MNEPRSTTCASPGISPDASETSREKLVVFTVGNSAIDDIIHPNPRSDVTTADPPLTDCPLLEDYVRRFPDLGPLDQLPDDPIAREYEARCRRGPPPAPAVYLKRFGPRPELLRELEQQQAERGRRQAVSTAQRLDAAGLDTSSPAFLSVDRSATSGWRPATTACWTGLSRALGGRRRTSICC